MIERPDQKNFTLHVGQDEGGIRIDQFICQKISDYSRTYIQTLIGNNHLTINDKIVHKSNYLTKPGDIISITIPAVQPIKPILKSDLPTNIGLKFEHDEFLIICKPPGLAVHRPRPTSQDVTLVEWLTGHFEEIKQVGYEDRRGIVHRLDKDTSGILIIARTQHAHTILSRLFKERKITKTYLAVVEGHPPETGSIDYYIKRHPTHRNKMTYSKTEGRGAFTFYKVLTYFETASLIEVKPITGRTHQIRVHMASIGHPIIGDLLYGNRSPFIARQALHAWQLSFTYEKSEFFFSCPLPADFDELIQHLKHI